MFDLSGKSALVTGAASGIGAATIRGLTRQGASVLGVDRDTGSLEEVVDSLRREGASIVGDTIDVSRREECERAVATCVAEFGRIDILVNNAGIGHVGTIEETDAEAWEDLIAVNMTGVADCSRGAIHAMRTQTPTGGAIINVASVAGLVGLGRRFAYSATKGAVLAMTRQMALDYVDDGIRVNAICPGTVDTPFVRAYLHDFHRGDEEEELERVRRRQPQGRLGTPEEIAAAIVYLASDESAYATGSFLVIDGGLTAR
jgi:2-keto-3-deoxy-L-fuconate dehydrogenase